MKDAAAKSKQSQDASNLEEEWRLAVTEPFLEHWLKSFEDEEKELRKSPPPDSDLEQIANHEGFRTWRALTNCLAHKGRVLKLFVHDDVFQRLWAFLKEHDAGPESWGIPTYSSSNASVPASILRDIESWHQTPKLTHAEFVAHTKKVRTLCDELLILLGKVSPSASYGDAFSTFQLGNNQIGQVLASLDSINQEFAGQATEHAKTWGALIKGDAAYDHKRYRYEMHFRYLLWNAGVTPTFVIQRLSEGSARASSDFWLPRKVKSSQAIRTYFIRRISETIPYEIEQTLLAEIVARVAETDCSADDVRKSLTVWRKRRARHDADLSQ